MAINNTNTLDLAYWGQPVEFLYNENDVLGINTGTLDYVFNGQPIKFVYKTATEYTQTITAKARIQIEAEQEFDIKANIRNVMVQNINAKAVILKTDASSISAKTNIKQTYIQNITSKANIVNIYNRSITAKTRIEIFSERTISAKSRIQRVINNTITAKANILVQLPPTVVLNNPGNEATFSDSTPTFDFTGTDSNSNDIRYEIQIGTSFSDDFNRTNSSTMGNGWTESVGNWSVSSNACITDNTAGSMMVNDVSFPTADYTVQCKIKHSAIGNGYWAGVVGRFTDTQNFYLCQFGRGADTLRRIQLYKKVSNSWTQIDSVEFLWSADTYYTVKMVMSGTSIKCYVDNNLKIDKTDSSLSAVGSPGLYCGTAVNRTTFDDFSAQTNSLIDKVSGTDTGFINPDNGGDTDPFTSGENIQFTLQPSDMLVDGTYSWRVRAIDPSGSNTYGDWSTARTFTIDAETVTKTITSKALLNITKIKTITAKSSILKSFSKTINAKSRIQINKLFTITSKLRINKQFEYTISAKSRIQNIYSSTVGAKCKIVVTGTTHQDFYVKGNILNINQSTISAKSAILIEFSKTITSSARIEISNTKTVTSKSNIKNLFSKNINALGRIQQLRTHTIQSKMRISIGSTRNISALASIENTKLITIEAKSRILQIFTTVLTSKARIGIIQSFDISAKSNIKSIISRTITAKSYITSINTPTINAKGNIKNNIERTINAKTSISLTFIQTLISKSRINTLNTKTTISKGSIKLEMVQMINSKSRINRNKIEIVNVKANISKFGIIQTITSKARIGLSGFPTISAKSDIKTVVYKTIFVKSNIFNSKTQTITAKSSIYRYPIRRCILYKPDNGTFGNSPITFQWYLPDPIDQDNIHCEIEIDNVDDTFTHIEHSQKSWLDNSNMMYMNDLDWVEFPTTGVPKGFANNLAKLTISLGTGIKYWRVRGGVK